MNSGLKKYNSGLKKDKTGLKKDKTGLKKDKTGLKNLFFKKQNYYIKEQRMNMNQILNNNYKNNDSQFYFIVDFCEQRNFNNECYDFNSISIRDRVLLSVYLTGIINNRFTFEDREQNIIEQMCNIIFNFNNKRKNNINTMDVVQDVKRDIKQFLIQKKNYCDFLNQNNIVQYHSNKGLFKIPLNSTEIDILNKMKLRKRDNIYGVIYILGTSKNHTTCAKLNQITYKYFSSENRVAKLLLNKLFKLMKWKYIAVNKQKICWKSKWKMKLNLNDLSRKEKDEKKIQELLYQ